MDPCAESIRRFLEPHLQYRKKPIRVTVTYAQSFDGAIAAGSGLRTQLSGPASLRMTHYLRSIHDAILVGRRTISTDNPRLNCRLSESAHHPRPIVLDSQFRWTAENSRLLTSARETGVGPWILVSDKADLYSDRAMANIRQLRDVGGDVVVVGPAVSWDYVLTALEGRGIRSVMVEGGAKVIETAFAAGVVDSVVITLAPVFLGEQSVKVLPAGRIDFDGQWTQLGPDCIFAGSLRSKQA